MKAKKILFIELPTKIDAMFFAVAKSMNFHCALYSDKFLLNEISLCDIVVLSVEKIGKEEKELLFSIKNLTKHIAIVLISEKELDISAFGNEIYGYIVAPFQKNVVATVFNNVQLRLRLEKNTTSENISDDSDNYNENENPIRTTLVSICEGLISIDTGGRIYMNPAAEFLTGWSMSDIGGKTLEEIYNVFESDDDSEANGNLQGESLISDIEHLSGHKVLISKDGTRYIITDTASPVKDSSGKITGTLIIFHNITGEYSLYEKLKEKEHRFAMYIKNAPFGIFRVNRQYLFIEVNEKFCLMAGYSEDELLGKNILSFISLEDNRSMNSDKQILSLKNESDTIIRFISKNRGERVCRINVFRYKDDAYYAFVDDITDYLVVENEIFEKTNSLGKRVRELNCLYGISKLVKKSGNSLDKIFQETVNLIPPLWQYPKITVCRIIYNNTEYRSKKFRETEWSISADINSENGVVGKIEVFYLVKMMYQTEDLFESDERIFLQAISEQLGEIIKRIEFQKALRESERLYRNIIENMQDVYYRSDKEGKLVLVSPSGLEMFGYDSYDGLIGTDMDNFYANRQVRRKLLSELHEKYGRITDYEIELRRKDGSTFPATISSVYYYDEKGRFKGVEGIVSDIAKRKETEKRLRMSEENFRSFFETVDDLIIICDLHGYVYHANSVVSKKLGYTLDELKKLRINDLFYFEKTNEQLEFADDSNYNDKISFLPLLGKHGEIIPAETRLLLGGWDDMSCFFLISKDLSDIQKTLEELTRIKKSIESTSDAIIILSLDGDHYFHNKTFSKMFEYGDEDFNKKIYILNHLENQGIIGDIMKTIEKSGSWSGETDIISKKGKKLSVDMRISAIFNNDNRIIGIVALYIDITNRKLVEEALKRSEVKFRTLYDTTKDAVMLLGQDSFINCNYRTLEMFGIDSKEEFCRLHPIDVSCENQADGTDSLTSANRYMKEAFENDSVFFEWLHINKKTGRVFPTEVLLSTLDLDGQRIIQATVRDISQRKQIERALRESEKQLKIIFDNAPVGIVIINVESHIIIDVNKYAQEVIGLDKEQIVGKKCFNLICSGEEGACPVTDLYQEVNHIQTKIISAAGKEIHILKTETVAELDSNRSVIINIFVNINKRLMLESQLAQAKKLEAIGQLAAGIAHEINTPIQYVGDNTRFLQQSFDALKRVLHEYGLLFKAALNNEISDDLINDVKSVLVAADIEYLEEEIPKAIEQTLEGIGRVSDIVRSMKEFSDPGGQEKTFANINNNIENTITVSRNEWKYISNMETDLAPSLPPVPCLPGEINQVFLNLIINASHAIADVVGDGSKGKGKIKISTREVDGFVEIRISDTGTGIPDGVRDKIFDPFFTTKGVGRGTGQGLSMARSVIVNKHNGSMTFESEMGKGTTFIIRLPLKEV